MPETGGSGKRGGNEAAVGEIALNRGWSDDSRRHGALWRCGARKSLVDRPVTRLSVDLGPETVRVRASQPSFLPMARGS